MRCGGNDYEPEKNANYVFVTASRAQSGRRDKIVRKI